ncbi:MAG: segregation/condensation protein A [Gluconobacter potus]|uniref:Segregation and condensation protein A n=1 Tax=Gluconobacter potus TaxID=2724927 RepID=A0ABR9YQP6_9PROT|nr:MULTISPECIES: segregation/condensation protein A [Gluconobacter]MBF0865961.1 segregation/condensation protein A [Gluconobacter sp. R71656]MBF0868641.1 segregation/condensation protein A [Gluconobacter sp. R75628]MBF0874623.1 segregation/condensation protein A [Gluconobacter sp. R75629]MBF0883933.1 segregation/condensation protein A [Gluconobacter potus]MBS1081696.1 segregation/condensation protein A [Gluconobacter kondonii]
MSEGALLEAGAWQGPLEALLQAVRRHAVDLRTLPLTELIDRFLACVEDGLRDRPLEQTADELVLAATLVQMRSALLLRSDAADHSAARSAAEHIQRVLLRKDTLQRAVEILERRPVLGDDVFGRGSVVPSLSVAETASLILTRDLLDALLSVSRRRAQLMPEESIFLPSALPRLSVQDAVAWWQQKLCEHSESAWDLIEGVMSLSPTETPQSLTHRKAAWAVHLAAVLELARNGELVLQQLTCGEKLKVVNAKPSINRC